MRTHWLWAWGESSVLQAGQEQMSGVLSSSLRLMEGREECHSMRKKRLFGVVEVDLSSVGLLACYHSCYCDEDERCHHLQHHSSLSRAG